MNQADLETLRQKFSLGHVGFFSSTTSTNDIAAQWLAGSPSHLSMIVADEQTSGRGRYGRTWYTRPNSALAVSFILTTGLVPSSLLRYSGLGSLAVCETLLGLGVSDVQIKWPNDILIRSKKVGGVLAEVNWLGDKPNGIILGIGINFSKTSLPENVQLNYPATYLEAHTKLPVDRLEVLEQIVGKIIEWNKKISTPEFIQAWEQKLAFMNQPIQVIFSKKESIEGKLFGIAENGEIVLKLSTGKLVQVNASEIQLRPS